MRPGEGARPRAEGRPGWRGETAAWQQTYTEAQQKERRRDEMPAKLAKLGILDAPKNACIYDLCCGSGEALDVLYREGFRNLHGIDFIPYPELQGETRFTFQAADVRSLPIPTATADWILNLHSLHHLENPQNVRMFLDECYRVLKPGGKLGIVDFPGSPQINLAFRLFLIRPLLITPYLKWFGAIIRDEWRFLKGYLAAWPTTAQLLYAGRFKVVRRRQEMFYYYLTLEKPGGS